MKKIKDDNEKIKYILDNYDFSLHSLLMNTSLANFPPKIVLGRYEYEYEPGKFVPNVTGSTLRGYKGGEDFTDASICFEMAILDLLSVLMYDPYEKTYDESLLPSAIRKNKDFIKIRKMLKSPNDVDSSAVKQKWLSLLGGKNKLNDYKKIDYRKTYKGKGYEIISNIENLFNILNNLLNIKKKDQAIKKIEDIGKKLSAGKRTITSTLLETKKVKFPEKWRKQTKGERKKIKLVINDVKFNRKYDIVIGIEPEHIYIEIPIKDTNTIDFFSSTFLKKLKNSLNKHYNKLLPFFILSTREFLITLEKPLDPTILSTIYYTLNLNQEVSTKIIQNYLKSKYNIKEYEFLKEFIYNLINKIDRVNPLISEICGLILSKKELMQDKKLKKYLLDHSAITLLAAIKENDISDELLESYIKKAKNINIQDSRGNTLLYSAILKGREKIAELLLKRNNLNINSQNKVGWTALMMAIRKRISEDLIKALIFDSRINLNIKEIKGRSALFFAIDNDEDEIIPLLIEKGAILDANCINLLLNRDLLKELRKLLKNPKTKKELQLKSSKQVVGVELTPLDYAKKLLKKKSGKEGVELKEIIKIIENEIKNK